jgi:hypothetical protein
MHRKNIVYTRFGTACGFRHPAGDLECVPVDKEE